MKPGKPTSGQRYDVCVVGLGAIGSQAALMLRRRGLSVIGIDRYAPPHQLGSSGGRTRMIREAYFEDPFYVPIVQRAYELWRLLEGESGQRLLTMTGGLMVGEFDGGLLSGALRSAQQHTVHYETLTGEEAERRFPAFRIPAGFVAVYERRAGIISAEAAIRVAISLCEQADVDLRFDERVLQWETASGGTVVHTDRGSYACRKLVLAGGPWVNELVNTYVPLTVARQPLLWFQPRSHHDWFDRTRFPVFLYEFARGTIFYGFPRDEDGVKVARHHHGTLAMPESLDRSLQVEDEQVVRAFLGQALPDASGQLAAWKVCMYTNTVDGNFLIDRMPGRDDAILVSACSGHGFKFAPAIGEIVADLVTDTTPRFDIDPFRFRPPSRKLPSIPALDQR